MLKCLKSQEWLQFSKPALAFNRQSTVYLRIQSSNLIFKFLFIYTVSGWSFVFRVSFSWWCFILGGDVSKCWVVSGCRARLAGKMWFVDQSVCAQLSPLSYIYPFPPCSSSSYWSQLSHAKSLSETSFLITEAISKPPKTDFSKKLNK